MLWFEDQVGRLMRVVLKIVQFVRIPQTMVANVLEAFTANHLRGWRMRVVALPKILVQHIVTSLNVVPLSQLPEAAAIHLPRGGQASRFEQRRPHVDVGNDFFDHRSASNHLRTMHQKRHPH